MTRDTLTRMEYYATVMSKELYPEVDHVMVKSVFTDDDLRPIDISFAFRSEQDALWFKLKYA